MPGHNMTTAALDRKKALGGASKKYLREARVPAKLEGSIKRDLTEFIFNTCDFNHDGQLDFRELLSAVRSMGLVVTHDELLAIFEKHDLDKSTALSLDEFTALTTDIIERNTDPQFQRKVEAAFRALDKDGDGFVSVEELRYILVRDGKEENRLSEADAERLLSEFDTDVDGRMDVSELTRLMLHAPLVHMMRDALKRGGITLSGSVANAKD
ncbi:unnamed protein product [Pedinophyceae sp. YPF-701]|nr:unnamed protein product [Pedinophyceae sp. YPF-701]